ncbi:MAG: folate-binding protein YgfZ [Planctomycetes bacterium]|nr:folate-binding protein YgfZ [Planctomycetota bacterium]
MSKRELDELWRERRARLDEEGGAPASFGDPDAEARAARAGAALFDHSDRDLLRIRGVKALAMLQGQLTNDVARLGPGDGCYAAHLDPKGKMLGDLVVDVEATDSVLLELERGLGTEFARRFAPFAMLDDLVIEDLGRPARLMLVGPEAAASLVGHLGRAELADLPAHAALVVDWQGVPLRIGARAETGERAYLVAGDDATLARFARALIAGGVRPAGGEAWEILRIEAGTPRWGRDMDGRNLPPECGIPHAISYSKGCYVGQETVARIRTYGQANRGLRGLRSTEAMPPGTELETREGKAVGRVTSSAWSPQLEAPIALGYVHRDQLEAGSALIGRADERIFEVEVAELPFVPRRFAPEIPR